MTAHAPAPDHVLRTRYRVGGMDCGSCAARIETALRRLDGVEDVSVSAAAGTMLVRHTPAMREDALAQLLGKLGFQMLGRADGGTSDAHAHAHDGCGHHGHAHGHAHEHAHAAPPARPRAHDHGHAHDHGALESGPWYASVKARLALACGAASLAALVATSFLPDLGQWPYVAAGAIGLAPIAARALAAARAGAPWTIELLMTIAAIGAVAIGAAEEAAAVVFLFLVGEVLEGLAARRARASIQSLADLAPKTALLRRDGQTREVAASALQIGDEILVRPGDRIPADGEILEGAGGIDESPVTGESAPVPKGVGAPVFAGAIALDAALVVRVTAAASDNTIARIVRLVEEAQEAKAPTERLIDRFARVYTPAVLAAGALVAIAPPLLAGADWREWIYKGLAVLLIGCPCALVISTPAAIAAGLSAGARRGLLLKGGAVLEQAGRITVAAFDKTGTLTQGRPVVTDVLPLSGDARDVLALAAGLETGASHPLAKAVLARAAADGVAPIAASDIAARPGAGVTGRAGAREIYFGSLAGAQALAPLNDATRERARALAAEGKSVSILLVDGQAAGLLAMRDEPRPDARAGLDLLRRRGVRTLMVTGDNRQTAQAVARALDIEPHAELLPADKQKIVRDLQARGEIVAKIGDGINDAPGLAAADIGVAMGGAADVALETADAAILNGRVADVWAMIRLSRSTMSNIRQNIAVALGLKAVFLVTTIAGVTGLWPAILADTGATVLVTMNALRLLSIRLHEEDAAPAD